jgi:hypothetical protein
VKDLCGNELSVGDTVVTNSKGGSSDLRVGTIIKFTATLAKVRYYAADIEELRAAGIVGPYQTSDDSTKLCTPKQMVRIENSG